MVLKSASLSPEVPQIQNPIPFNLSMNCEIFETIAVLVNSDAPDDTLLIIGLSKENIYIYKTKISTFTAFAVLKHAPIFLGSSRSSKIRTIGSSISVR